MSYFLLSMHRGCVYAVLSLFLCSGSHANAEYPQAPRIAAASALQFALTDIANAFRTDSGKSVVLSFGSSGNFVRLIRQGAPFEVYLSADERYVTGLFRDGFARDEGKLYSIGRLAIVVPHGSSLKADGSLEDLKKAIIEQKVSKFAIANPEHAPYGKRAEEVLRSRGLWNGIRPKLVFGENISQAAQFATSPNADGGIIAYSLALSPQVASRGAYALIPDDWHSPLRQRMVLLKNAGVVAEQFFLYLQQGAARAILSRYGFNAPPDMD